jgi:hypothetical protein
VSVDAPEKPPTRDRRRRPAPPAAAAWRWGFPVLLVGLAALTLLLSATGARLVLDSRDGQVGRSEQDPTKPGYVATVAATPLLLVVHGDGENLYGAVVMALGDDDTGGAAVFLSPDTVVRPGERGRLDEIYEDFGVDSISGDGLRSALSTLVGADIDTPVIIDATSLEPLIEPVAPLRFEIAEAVKVRGKTVLAAGEAEITTADDIAAATETLGSGENAADRLGRQTAFWSAWIRAVQANPEGAFPSGGADTPLARFLRGFAAQPTLTVPLQTVPFGGATVADTEWLASVLPDIVPYPRQEGVRLNVAVRNGVAGDLELSEAMERRLVAAGAQIASRGNADSFGVTNTSVVYHDPALEDRANDLAEAIGATDVRYEEKVDSEIQVTVTIGADFDPSEPGPSASTPSTSTGAPR